jgi:hypothetical protein
MRSYERVTRSRWWLPGFSVFLGALMFAAFAIGGDLRNGIGCFVLMTLVGAVFLFGRRSETLQGLAGPGRDERWAMIDLRATAFAGFVLLTVLIGTWLYAISQGEDGSPYGQLLAISGIAYIVGVVLGRWRS